jgi:hypothetical protein
MTVMWQNLPVISAGLTIACHALHAITATVAADR